MSKKIIFIDLDGTLIDTHSGETFPRGVWDMSIKWDMWKALKSFVKDNKTEFVCIVTNQGGIESGYVDEENWFDKFRYVQSALQEYLNQGNDLDVEVYGEYCISNDKDCDNRKPNSGMLRHFLSTIDGWDDYNDINYVSKSEMIMIGDASGKPNDFSDSDKKTADNFEIDYLDVNEMVRMVQNNNED